MPSAYRQFRWSRIQKIIAGIAVALAGIAIAFAELPFGAVTIPQSPVFGALIALAGIAYAVSAGLSLRNRPRPMVHS